MSRLIEVNLTGFFHHNFKNRNMKNIKFNTLFILASFLFAFSAQAQYKSVDEVNGKAVGERGEHFQSKKCITRWACGFVVLPWAMVSRL